MFFSSITKFFFSSQSHAAPAQSSALNLNQARLPERPYCEGSSLLSAIEKTNALINFLRDSTSVSLDRIAGTIEIENQGHRLRTDLLQIASEVCLKRGGNAKLFLTPSSPLGSSMTAEHLGKVESLLRQGAALGKILPGFGILSPAAYSPPYSRLGKDPYTPLPDTVQHGDYQFFAPGPERSATIQFLSGLGEDHHVILPSLVLNGEQPAVPSNVRLHPTWHLVALGNEINSQLQKLDRLTRFHNLIFAWADFLSYARFDLRGTVFGLASTLGLEIEEHPPRFRGGPTRFSLSNGDKERTLVVSIGHADSSGRQELSVGWAQHLWGAA